MHGTYKLNCSVNTFFHGQGIPFWSYFSHIDTQSHNYNLGHPNLLRFEYLSGVNGIEQVEGTYSTNFIKLSVPILSQKISSGTYFILFQSNLIKF